MNLSCFSLLSVVFGFAVLSAQAAENVSLLLKRADNFLEKKDMEKSISAYSEAIRLDPKNVKAYCSRARAYGIKGELKRAREDIETAIKLAPNDAEVHYVKAMIYVNSGDAKTGIHEASKAIRLNPLFAKAHCKRGVLLLRGMEVFSEQVELLQAEQDLRKAIELKSDYSEALCFLGIICRIRGDSKAALENLNRSIAFDGKQWRNFHCRADVYLENEDYSAAIDDYNSSIELNPHIGISYANRGLAFHATNDEARAQADWAMARKVDSRAAMPHLCLARVHFINGNVERSLRECNYALCIDPNNSLAYLVRAEVNGTLGKLDDMLADATAAIRLAPNDGACYVVRAGAYEERGEYQKAIADCNEAIRYGEANNVYRVRGQSYAGLGDVSRATEDLEKSLRLNPTDPKRYFDLGQMWMRNGDLRKAWQYCELAIDHDPMYAEAYVLRALIHIEQNQNERAIADTTEAIRRGGPRKCYAVRSAAELALGYVAKADADFQEARLDQSQPMSKTIRLGLLVAKREFARAREECERQLSTKPSSFVPYLYRSRINNAESRFTEALQDATESMKRGGGLAAQIERGKALQKLGRYQEAIQELDNIIAAAPNWPQGYVERGHIRLELGELKQAIDDETQAIRLGCDQNSYLLRGMAYMLASDLDKAEADFRKVTTITLDRLRGQLGLAAVAARRKDAAKTAEHLTKAIQIDRNNSIALNNLAVAQAAGGELNAAIANLDEAVRLSPQMYEAYQNRAAVHRRMGNQEKAATDQVRAKELAGDRAAKFGADYIRHGLRPEVNLIEMLPAVEK